MHKVVSFPPSIILGMQLIKKHTVVLLIALVALAIPLSIVSLIVWYNLSPHDLRFVWPGETLTINSVGWNVSLAKAIFNLTAGWNPMTIEHVEVNDTVVDFQPESIALNADESILVRVYFPYEYNSTYRVEFYSRLGYAHRYDLICTRPLN